MYNFVLKFHSGWAYIALLMLVIAVANALMGLTSKNEFSPKDRKISLFGLIGLHIQLVIGLILYFVSPNGFQSLGNMEKTVRLTSLEHPIMGIIAIVLITIGWSKHKKVNADKKFKTIVVFYGIGLLFVLSKIPWSNWL